MLRITTSAAISYAQMGALSLALATIIPRDAEFQWHQSYLKFQAALNDIFLPIAVCFCVSLIIAYILTKMHQVALSECLATLGFMALFSPLLVFIEVFPYGSILATIGTISLYLSVSALCGLLSVKKINTDCLKRT